MFSQFLHNVILVSREQNIWKVRYQNVLTGEEFEEEFDFVIVGTGHYSKPNYPDIPNEELFKGKALTFPNTSTTYIFRILIYVDIYMQTA